MTTTINSINTRPEANVLSVFKHLNYTLWGALAEYVDNSVQSYIANRTYFVNNLNQRSVKVNITLDYSNKFISISDNAAGILAKDFPRAFRPAAIPPDTKGLNEFGLGMKTASCWISPVWTVRTKAINDNVVRTVVFDVEKISRNKIDDVPVKTESFDPSAHFTVVELTNVFRMFPGVTQKKIKEHLLDIYRIFIRDNLLELYINNEKLLYEAPILLKAPPFNDPPNAAPFSWRREISFLVGEKQVTGYIGILESMSNTKSGLVLFRRGRAIVGSGDNPYKPSNIFGASNSFKYRRLIGEFHLDEFSVTSQKDAFTWQEFDDGEDGFLEILKNKFNEGRSFISQAENYRSTKAIDDFPVNEVDKLLKDTAKVVSDSLKEIIDKKNKSFSPAPILPELPQVSDSQFWTMELKYQNDDWRIKLELTKDPSVKKWLTISERGAINHGTRTRNLGLSMSMKNPFMIEYLDADLDNLEPIFRLAVALGIAEVLARESGDTKAGLITKWVNDLLSGALSKDRK